MEFLQNNWLWISVIALFVLMQATGMGCGGHRRHGRGGADNKKEAESGKHGCC